MKLKKILFILATLITISTGTAVAQSQGKATYYGNKFHGRRTSDGSVYHKDSLTCAHRTLPFGTLLRVRNLANNREVVVKVTDRGPFRRGGIVDLSLAAAKEIGMVAQGVVHVEVTEVGHVSAPQYDDAARSLAAAGIPQPKYIDPATGEFYTLDEWKSRGEAEQKRRMAQAAKKQQPRYRVMGDKLTAKNIKVNAVK